MAGDDVRTEFLSPVGRDNPEYTAEITRSPYTVPGVSDGGAHMQMISTGAYPTDCGQQLYQVALNNSGGDNNGRTYEQKAVASVEP